MGGLIFLYLLYANSDSLFKNAKNLRSGLFGISTGELVSTQREIENKIELMNDQVVRSLSLFSTAMGEYAKHIASHTSAVQSLAEAAKHLENIMAAPASRLRPPAETRDIEFPPAPLEASPTPQPIPVTPELKAVVKDFIRRYAQEHYLDTIEVTPELMSAVWEFIKDFTSRRNRETAVDSMRIDEDVTIAS